VIQSNRPARPWWGMDGVAVPRMGDSRAYGVMAMVNPNSYSSYGPPRKGSLSSGMDNQEWYPSYGQVGNRLPVEESPSRLRPRYEYINLIGTVYCSKLIGLIGIRGYPLGYPAMGYSA